MADSFQGRIKKLADHFGSFAELVRRSRVSRRTIGAWASGETKPRHGELLKLAAATNCSLEWLASGRGEMFGPGATAPARLAYHSKALREEMRAASPDPGRYGFVFIPLYDQQAGAAQRGRVVSEAEHPVGTLAFREDWVRSELHSSPEQLRLIHVEGDSMEPELRAGDIILVDLSASAPTREGVYVVRMEDALLVKHLQRLPGGVVRLTSRNPTYEPVTLPLPSFDPDGPNAIVGRVVWACRRL